LQSEFSWQLSVQSVFGAHFSVQLLASTQRALQLPFVHVKLQVSLPLHSQFVPHSRGPPGGVPVSGAPVSRAPPPSGVGFDGDDDDEPDGAPDEDGGISALPVPMFQS
jgi:hypothetical protein